MPIEIVNASNFGLYRTRHSEIREVQLQPVNPKFTTLARISVMALHRSIVGFLDSVGMWAQVRSGCGLKSFCGEVISRKIRRCLIRGRRLPSPGMRWCGTRERQGRSETTLERGQSGSSEAWCLPRPRGSALLFPSLRRSPPVHLNRQRSAERL